MTAAAAAAEAATLNATGLWKDALNELKFQMTQATFNQWLKGSQGLRLDGNCLVIQVGNEYAVDWLENRLKPTIVRTVRAIADDDLDVVFAVDGSTRPEPAPVPAVQVPAASNGNGHVAEEPDPPPAKAARPGGAGAVHIDIHDPEPTHGFVAIPHYAQRFWRPFLGLVPFTLWEVLRSYGYYVQRYGQEWPTIDMLSESMGYGTRHTVLGRRPAGAKKGIEGAVDVLQRHRLIYYWTEGEARRTRYFFKVRETLPVLSVAQLSKLPPKKREEHALYLSYYREFDVVAWENDDRESFIPEWWVPQNG